MKAFQLIPSIAEYPDFAALAGALLRSGPADLILTNEYIYNPTIASLDLGCHTCFQEKYGAGEPTDVMVERDPERPAGQGLRPHRGRRRRHGDRHRQGADRGAAVRQGGRPV